MIEFSLRVFKLLYPVNPVILSSALAGFLATTVTRRVYQIQEG